MPEATSPTTSEPCSASTRGLPRLFRSTIAPSSASTKPVNRLLFLHALSSGPQPGPNHCDRKAGIVSPTACQVECDRRGKPESECQRCSPITKHKDRQLNLNCRQVCSESLCGGKGLFLRHPPLFKPMAHGLRKEHVFITVTVYVSHFYLARVWDGSPSMAADRQELPKSSDHLILLSRRRTRRDSVAAAIG